MFTLSIALLLSAVIAVVAGQGNQLSQDDKMAGTLGTITCGSQSVVFVLDNQAAINMAISDPAFASTAVVHEVYAGKNANFKECHAVNAGGLISLSIPYTECNTIASTENDKFVYRNTLTIIVRTRVGMFQQDITFKQMISCSVDISINLDHQLIPPFKNLNLLTIEGRHNIKIEVGFGQAFKPFMDFSSPKEIITIEFSLLEADQAYYRILVDSCYIAPDLNSQIGFGIMKSRGCVTELAEQITNFTINGTTQKLEFVALKLVEDSDALYVHCQVNVCKNYSFQSRCTPDCNYTPYRDVGGANDKTSPGIFFSNIKVKLDKNHTGTHVIGANGQRTIFV